jgi:hypothetical protein
MFKLPVLLAHFGNVDNQQLLEGELSIIEQSIVYISSLPSIFNTYYL